MNSLRRHDAGTEAYLETRGGRTVTSTPRARSGATCWNTRNRLDGASRPETTASTRTGRLAPGPAVPSLTGSDDPPER